MSSKNGSKKTKKAATEEEVPTPLFKFKWEGRTHSIALDDLNFGERGDMEEYLGQPWPMVIMSAWSASYKALMFLAFVALQRDGVDVKLDDLRELTEDDIVIEGEADDDGRPTEESGDSGRRRSGSGSGSSRGK